MKRLLNAVAVVGLASSGILVSAVAAEAAVPTCVSTSAWSSGIWQYAKAANGCSSTQRFYFRWDRAVDGSCVTYAPDSWRQEGRLYQARFAGLTSC